MTRLCPRLPRRVLALVLVPPLLWALALTLFPTEWARRRIESRLSQATGRRARLHALRVGWVGDVQLGGLELAQPEPAATPWLRVRKLRLNLSLLHLMTGRCEPSRVDVEDVELRVHRDRAGRFEFGDLLRAPASAPTAGAHDQAHGDPAPMTLTVRNGRVTIIDEPSDTRLEIRNVAGEGSWQPHCATVRELSGEINGGRIDLAAQVDRSPDEPAFEAQARARGVALEDGMGALGYLIPVLAGAGRAVQGRLDLNLYLHGQGATRSELQRSLAGHGALTIDPVQLDGSPLVAELADLLDLPPRDRIGSVRSQFAIGKARVSTDRLTVTIGQVPIVLAGWTGFDGHIDYQISQGALIRKLPEKARRLLADLPVDLSELVSLRVEGTLDNLDVRVDGPPDDGNPSRHADERLRLREYGRRLRDRILK